MADDVVDYFGASVGMYFAFLGHYSKWLVFPSILGIILMVEDFVWGEGNGVTPFKR